MQDDEKDQERRLQQLNEYVRKYTEWKHRFRRPKSVFSYLGGGMERKFHDALLYFLDPDQPHGFNDQILRAFLTASSNEIASLEPDNLLSETPNRHIEVQKEVSISDDNSTGRIDLVIGGGDEHKDHPKWVVMCELKVGQDISDNQRNNYKKANSWNFSWFGNDSLNVQEPNNLLRILIGKENKLSRTTENSGNKSNKFYPVSWKQITAEFKNVMNKNVFDLPQRSVVQYRDLLRTMCEISGNDDQLKQRHWDKTNEFAQFFFENAKHIEHVENAKSTFHHILNDLAENLRKIWTKEMNDEFLIGTEEGWYAERNDDYEKYQWIGPEHWRVEKDNNELRLGFVHSTTADALRNKQLSFRLRLPPQRNLHTRKDENDKSFNDHLRGSLKKRKKDIRGTFDGSTEIDFDASALLGKTYPLKTTNITEDYVNKLVTACDDFCGNTELIEVINEAFEEAYEKIYGTTEGLTGDKPEELKT